MNSERHTHSVARLIEDSLLTIGDGYRAKNVELASTGIPFARVANIDGGFNFAEADLFPLDGLHKVGNKISRPGDVVLTSKGTVGRFAFVHEGTPQFVYSPQLSYWRSLDFNTINPRFLFYWIQGEEFQEQADGVKSQTDMADYVSLTDQRRMKITLPSVEEQRAIARILGALDDKIELNRRMNHTLQEMASGLFKSWFVDFDPVVCKSQSRHPYGMNAELSSLFPSRFQPSELGTIPEGWRAEKLGSICELAYGKSLTAQQRKLGSVAVFGSDGQIGWHDTALVKGEGIVVGRKGNAGKVNWAYTDFFPIDTTFYVIRKSKKLPLSYLFHALQNLDLDNISGDSAVPGLNREMTYQLDVLVPDDKILQAFDKVVGKLRAQIGLNEKQSRSIIAIRDTLLPKLLSGQLRIKQAKKVIDKI